MQVPSIEGLIEGYENFVEMNIMLTIVDAHENSCNQTYHTIVDMERRMKHHSDKRPPPSDANNDKSSRKRRKKNN